MVSDKLSHPNEEQPSVERLRFNVILVIIVTHSLYCLIDQLMLSTIYCFFYFSDLRWCKSFISHHLFHVDDIQLLGQNFSSDRTFCVNIQLCRKLI
jgi:hypothetical protein